DGARLFNAVVASGIPASEYAAYFDTVSFCISKGLGAPVGSLVAGEHAVIRRMRHFRRMYGGGMRQAGILAAAGIYALEHHITRRKEDHVHAQRLATLLQRIPDVGVKLEQVESNIVMFEVNAARGSGSDLIARLRQRGVLINSMGG